MVGASARLLAVLLADVALLLVVGGCKSGAVAPAAGPTVLVASPPSNATPLARPPQSAPAPLAAASATVPPSSRPITEPTRIEWDAHAVAVRPETYYRIPCPAAADPARSNPGIVFSLDTLAQLECVVQAMRAAAASEAAVSFLQRYGVFLVAFEERGRVDIGSIAAAWQNMGRPEPALLNSAPAMLPLRVLVGAGPGSLSRQWIGHPVYSAALGGDADVLPWPEYAIMTEQPGPEDAASGGQRFLAELPLRKCRACASPAMLRVAFRFAAGGASASYTGWELWSPGAPPPAPTPGGR